MIAKPVLSRFSATWDAFVQLEIKGSLFLLLALGVALVGVNTQPGFLDWSLWLLWGGDLPHPITIKALVNDGLMTLFFLVVGLEIQEELAGGELATLEKALFPAFAAAGGMLIPTLINLLWNPLGSAGFSGWGIPIATDIGLSLGVLALLGSRVPRSLKVFLLSLAILDDIGSILVISVFYSQSLATLPLVMALGLMFWLIYGRQQGWFHPLGTLLVGGGLWGLFWKAGLHPTLAGVVVGLTIPITGLENSPHRQVTQWLHPAVTYGILPLFALVNGGVVLHQVDWQAVWEAPVFQGVFWGALLGKPIGIVGASVLAVWLGWAHRPAEVRWRAIVGVGILGAIGFTVALFINELAFVNQPFLLNQAKLAILAASSLAAVFGLLALFWVLPLTKVKSL